MDGSFTVRTVGDAGGALPAVLEEADRRAMMTEDLICIRAETPDRKIAEFRLGTFKRTHCAWAAA